jgi:hypothetical protein
MVQESKLVHVLYVEACVAGPLGSRVVGMSCTYYTKRVGKLKSTFNRLGRVTDEVVQAIMVDFILGRFPIFRIHIGAICSQFTCLYSSFRAQAHS